MRSRTAFEILACTFAIGCGGGLFTGGSDDAGADVSSGGTGSGATGSTGSGTGTSGPTSGTSGSGSSGAGSSGTTTGSTATTSASTTGAGGAVGTGGTGGSGFAGNGGTGGKAGAGGSSGKAGAGGASDGGGVDWGACTGVGQCTAEITGCCPPCATPELDRFAGVNAKYVDAFRSATCPVPTPCPRCAAFPNPYIGARCAGTRCEAFDVRKMPEISKCGANDECRLRKGLDCCECGSLDDWTAVSATGQSALMSLVCAPMSVCPACVPVPPPNMQAVCNAGHCEVAGVGLGGP